MNQRNGILALCAVLALGVGLANPLASVGLVGTAAIALAILLVAALLWVTEAIPLYATSFLVLLLCLTWLHPALVDTGSTVERGVFLAPFFSDIVLLFLGGFDRGPRV
ncbi:MAG: SLC13/DASS family transporter, partial [Myxococcota bacterium]